MNLTSISRFGIHYGEEAVLPDSQNLGMILFKGCHLRCSFCYSKDVSHQIISFNRVAEELAFCLEILVARGVPSIMLVSPTHVWRQISQGLEDFKSNYPQVKIILKISGMQGLPIIKEMSRLAEVIVPDFKFHTPAIAKSFGLPETYPRITMDALKFLIKHKDNYLSSGQLDAGVLIRHLLVPGHLGELEKIVNFLWEHNFEGYFNIMTNFIDPKAKKIVKSIVPQNIARDQYPFSLLINGQSVGEMRSYA